MKKKLLAGLAVGMMMAVTIFTGPVAADTITGITLSGGYYDGSNWSWNGQGWTTNNTGWWVLGTSSTPNGTLVNQPDTTISVLFDLDYWLYASSTYLGTATKVEVTTAEKGVLTTIFTLSGSAGIESPWSILQGSSLLQLGWASGSADKVGPGNQMTPNGSNDFYLHLQAGNPQTATPTPEPATMLLMGTGLAGLIGARRKKKK